MDNAQKAIMIGVGLFITIIIISAVLLIVNLGTGLVDDATGELASMSTSLQNQILQSYDNKVLSGTQVRSAIQQYLKSADMTVVLMKDASTVAANVGAKEFGAVTAGTEKYTVSTTEYGTPTGTALHKTSMSAFTNIEDVANNTYINANQNYNSYVLEVEGTNTIVGVVFVPKS